MAAKIQNLNSAKVPGRIAVTPNMYTCVINVSGAQGMGRNVFPMRANLPEKFHLEMSSSWTTPFAQADLGGIAGGLGGLVAGPTGAVVGQGVANAAAGAAGVGTRLKSQTIQVWESSSPLAINLDLMFHAQTNTERDVKLKQLALLKLAAPSSSGEVLYAPGPHILDGLSNVGGRRTTVQIGNYMFLSNVIVKSVSTDIDTLFDASGNPIAMSINVGFETWNACVTAEDLDAMFSV